MNKVFEPAIWFVKCATRVQTFNHACTSRCRSGFSGLFIAFALPLIFMSSGHANATSDNVLSLERAIEMAQQRDDWLVKSRFEQQRLTALSQGATALPDPTLSIGILNLPTDGFAFDQEPMTQIKVGASQMFPRGDTLALQETQLKQSAEIQPVKRADRRQKVALQTTLMWLDAYQNQASYALVKDTKPLFDKLGEIVSASYASSVGKANQQDLIRAELELVRLQDRLVTLSTQKEVALSRLTQFLNKTDFEYANEDFSFKTVGTLPALTDIVVFRDKHAVVSKAPNDQNTLYRALIKHPLLVAIEQQIQAERTEIEIAKQSHKPQFGVNASYALRDDAPAEQGGSSRADFFSVGMSMSLPLFSTDRQDAQVTSSIHKVEATKTEKLLILRELMAGLKSSLNQYHGAEKRLAIYQDQILPQMSQQSEAALNAYTNDIGDFAEVVRAKIAELDAQITTIGIDVQRYKALATIQYYLFEYHGESRETQGSVHSTIDDHKRVNTNTEVSQND